ncbi:hypothetical protein EMQ25_11180 [Arsenicitalea aurantiaca]|uniref:Uncharacterized protein n=1 Tax=Arsenicitalea aurantiaca TaxID=1783274 RepID=A0A433XBH9_9HYPH|nr:hypothetical protein [Arsenicitalea aurantiaca]RUT31404.1 hypothetical protein EMQ25_11180 [Arsenicitalea aurantiaca]
MSEGGETGRLAHRFRPLPLGRVRVAWLEGRMLHWRIGRTQRRAPLASIAAIHRDHPEAGRPWTTTIRFADGRTLILSDRYWHGWGRDERHRIGTMTTRKPTLDALTATLAIRTLRANPEVVLSEGLAPDIRTCARIALLLASGLGIGALIVLALLPGLALPALLALAIASVLGVDAYDRAAAPDPAPLMLPAKGMRRRNDDAP